MAGSPLVGFGNWVWALVGVTVVSALAVLVGRRLEGPWQASLYAFAAAAIMALQSGLLDATIAHFKHGLGETFTSWQPYAMVVASIVGLTLIQSAYQAGPLASSMPVMDATEPTVAIVIGVALFSEQINTGVINAVLTVAGLVALLVGIVALDTSPVVQRLHEEEEEQQGDDIGDIDDVSDIGDALKGEERQQRQGADSER